MSDREYPPRDGIRMGMVDGEYGRAIAYRIRAELVCCYLYNRVQAEAAQLEKAGDPLSVRHAIARAVLRREWHELCYWGEASAQIAEGRCPGYETDPNVCQCPCKGCKHNCGAHQEPEEKEKENDGKAAAPARCGRAAQSRAEVERTTP